MNNNFICPACNSEDLKILEDNLAECLNPDCKEIFEIEDELTPKVFKTRPSRKVEENLEDGF